MKLVRLLLTVFVAVVIASAALPAQEQKSPLSPAAQASVDFADGKGIVIKYSQPSMRGRTIFGDLVPYGKEWRTGANAATSFVTTTDLNIGGQPVPAGSYTLYSIPDKSSWVLIINKETGQWGTKYDQSQDLAQIPMKVSQLPSAMEKFTISLDKTGAKSATLKLEWEKTSASVNITEK